jgi:hypothetical protein
MAIFFMEVGEASQEVAEEAEGRKGSFWGVLGFLRGLLYYCRSKFSRAATMFFPLWLPFDSAQGLDPFDLAQGHPEPVEG